MNNTKNTMAIFISTCLILGMTGCATAYDKNNPYNLAIAGKVVREQVSWWEKDDHLYAKPASYNVAAKEWKWGPNANRYRWVITEVSSRKLRLNWWRYVIVPDQLPILKSGDLIDVYEVNTDELDLNNLHASVALRLVCRADDKPCMEKSKKEIGRTTEIISEEKPNLEEFTYTPKYDKEGRRLK